LAIALIQKKSSFARAKILWKYISSSVIQALAADIWQRNLWENLKVMTSW
jgi:hypothetical protein